jgi:hypothetical protein
MARINSYTKITGAPADSDCFIIDSTQGTAGTRIVLWSVLKSVLTGIFASKSHKHPGSDITSAVGNANAATNDSTGQNIASTYVKSVTANGRTITVKRGNDTTFTFQTQDTTYPFADASKSGIMTASDWSLLHSLNDISQNIASTYVKEITANGRTITVKRGNDTTFTFQTQDTTYPFADASKSGIMAASDWSLLHSLKDIGQTIASTYVKSVTASGRTVTVTKGNGATSTFTTQDTTYSVATQSANGLMSSADKRKLDGLSSDVVGSIPLATPSRDGLMPKADKAKLDAIGSISNSTIDGFFTIR